MRELHIGQEVTFTIPKMTSGDVEKTLKGHIFYMDLSKSDWLEVEVKIDWKTKRMYNINRGWIK